MPLIDVVAGARPNFVKIASIIDAITAARARGHDVRHRLVHTGQHFDHVMSDAFFGQLGIPLPDVNLGAGGGSMATVAGTIMLGYEKLLASSPADCCIVVGDVTSTMACAISAKRAGLPLAHVEAGIRSFDMSMPEELNRMVTDAITDWFFTTSRWAGANLRDSGVQDERIFFVGNTMIDTLLKHRNKFARPSDGAFAGLIDRNYIVLTLHRPGNVDDRDRLMELVYAVCEGVGDLPVVFPVHPRTAKNLNDDSSLPTNLRVVPSLPYLEFNGLVQSSIGVLTDSGGITEEATVMGIPCGTIRNSTERPETVTQGTNELLGTDPVDVKHAARRMASQSWKEGSIPELWDGNTGPRIVEALCKLLDA